MNLDELIPDEALRQRWVSLKEAAEIVGVNEKTVRRWISLGLIVAKRFGPKLIRVHLDSLMALGRDILPYAR